MFNKILLTTLFLVCFTLVVSKPLKFENCGGPDVPLKAVEINISPGKVFSLLTFIDIVRPGNKFQISTNFMNSAETPITNGITTVRVYKFGINVQTSRSSVCDGVNGGCPIQRGPITGVLANTIPSMAPGGEYLVMTKSVDRDGKVLSCVDMRFDVTTK
jgi:hypothetical protein